jgi:hypothetical protein
MIEIAQVSSARKLVDALAMAIRAMVGVKTPSSKVLDAIVTLRSLKDSVEDGARAMDVKLYFTKTASAHYDVLERFEDGDMDVATEVMDRLKLDAERLGVDLEVTSELLCGLVEEKRYTEARECIDDLFKVLRSQQEG